MKLDIISINLNNKDGLEKTIESVINQTFFDKVNFIIIDGGSTDGSKELIEEYKDKLFHYVSEPDGGIYNAMNKGIRASVSDYLLFLNSGDYLSQNNVLERIFPYLDGKYDIVYGNEIKMKKQPLQEKDPFAWCSNQMKYRWFTQGKWHHRNLKATEYPDVLTEDFFKRNALPHQSTFIKRELQIKHPYDEHYKVISDWKFLRERTIDDKVPYKHVPITVSVFDMDGFSMHNHQLILKEWDEYYHTCT